MLVLGADGRLGRRVMDRLAGCSVSVVPLGRDADPSMVVDGDVVVNVATAAPDVVVPWALAGSHAAGYVDAVPSEASHRALADQELGPAAVVLGAGFSAALGDALAVVAAQGVTGPRRVDVTTWVPARRSLLATATPRERCELADLVLHPGTVLERGDVHEERVAEDRRLAWFPRPVGPHHAAGVPGPHWRTLPRILPTVRTARTALALRSWMAELLQGLGNAARLPSVADRVRRRAAGGRRSSGGRRGADTRWAIVVEVDSAADELARGWAYGQDRHAVTAALLAAVADQLVHRRPTTRRGPAGVAEVVDAGELLDHLAATTGLRWSITVPGDA